MFDYGKTIGIDVNKELLAGARTDGTCPGYFEEGVVVRDNYVFNHGHTGYNISGPGSRSPAIATNGPSCARTTTCTTWGLREC